MPSYPSHYAPPGLLILNAAEMVTCASGGKPLLGPAMAEPGIIPNGALAITGDRITAAGTTSDILAAFPPGPHTRVLDAAGKTVTPGWVDCHTHLVFAGSREQEYLAKLRGASYLDILKAGGGILSTVRATRKASREELLAIVRKKLEKMTAWGTTTVEIKSGYGLDLATERKILEVAKELADNGPATVHTTFLGAHAVPEEYRGREEAYVDLVIHEMLPGLRGLADACDVFCDEGAFTLNQTERILEAAGSLGYRLKVHAGEFRDLGAVELAARIGALSADHLDQTSPAAMDRMAETGVTAVLLPGVNFFLNARPFAPARELIERGVAVAVATDYNPGSCPCFSMPMIMAMACRFLGLVPAEAIVACTINAAHALGAAGECGSLEPGKRADVLILDAPNHAYVPYHFGDQLVETVIAGGQVINTK